MAQKVNRTTSAEENTIKQDFSPVNDPPSRYECPICMCWLNEPVLTSCGHLFCKKCLTSWLKKQNSCCPIDNKPLFESDIFPDNFIKREIHQIREPCPNAGCSQTVSPMEMESHVMECLFRERTLIYECLFKHCGCDFKGISEGSLKEHLEHNLTIHLNFLLSAFTSISSTSNMSSLAAANSKFWDAPNKNQSSTENGDNKINTDLIRAMYERIVVLEQRNKEQDLKILQLGHKLTESCHFNEINPRYSNGVIIWKITKLQSKIETMRSDPNIMFYSNVAYTSPYGYKFCCRFYISPKCRDSIALHIHLMRSENDIHLDWPFNGRIKISMIHPRNYSDSHHDTIMSKPEILAFHKPTEDISPRGFGFLEYANIKNVLHKNGFITNDSITVKVHMNIV